MTAAKAKRPKRPAPQMTADPLSETDPLSQSDLQALASAANRIEPARADALAVGKDYAPGAIPFDSPRTLVGKADPVKAAGIAVRAKDTGRVLMLQRSTAQGKDPNAGTWEFPGGRLNDGEHPRDAARREWQEEMGVRLPRGKHAGSWRAGVYQGFVHEVPNEDAVKLNLDGDDRRVRNPDDPDGDNAEVAAWWHPTHLRYMRALRPELRACKVWSKVEKAQAHPATLRLRVHGVSSAPGGHRVYRMETRDGHYVGRTNPTRFRARKGDVLKVQAQDYLTDVQGDPRWTNAGVVGFDDTPHSWKELQAFAGGRIVDAPVDKDAAPGDAGNLPAPGDPGIVRMIGGDGPTLAAVHVNIPLDGLSQAYVNRQTRRRFKPANDSVLQGEFLPVAKGQEWKQLVYGVVLEPNAIDSQDDFMLPHHVERTAHGYLKKAIRGRSSVAKLQHGAHRGGFSKTQSSIVPVESFIAPVDFSYDGKEQIKKGSWVLAMHVEDPELWQDFLDGKYRAFSVGGSGVRRAVRGAADLVPHGLIGEYQPNYFEPDPRRMALVAGG